MKRLSCAQDFGIRIRWSSHRTHSGLWIWAMTPRLWSSRGPLPDDIEIWNLVLSSALHSRHSQWSLFRVGKVHQDSVARPKGIRPSRNCIIDRPFVFVGFFSTSESFEYIIIACNLPRTVVLIFFSRG